MYKWFSWKLLITLVMVTLMFSVLSYAVSASNTAQVCHKPGTPAEHTLHVAPPAVQAHLGHGDYEGRCQSGPGEADPDPLPLLPEPPAGIEVPGGAQYYGLYSVRLCADLYEWGGYLNFVDAWVNGVLVEELPIAYDLYVPECLQFDAIFGNYIPLNDVYFTQAGGELPLMGWYSNSYGEVEYRHY